MSRQSSAALAALVALLASGAGGQQQPSLVDMAGNNIGRTEREDAVQLIKPGETPGFPSTGVMQIPLTVERDCASTDA